MPDPGKGGKHWRMQWMLDVWESHQNYQIGTDRAARGTWECWWVAVNAVRLTRMKVHVGNSLALWRSFAFQTQKNIKSNFILVFRLSDWSGIDCTVLVQVGLVIILKKRHSVQTKKFNINWTWAACLWRSTGPRLACSECRGSPSACRSRTCACAPTTLSIVVIIIQYRVYEGNLVWKRRSLQPMVPVQWLKWTKLPTEKDHFMERVTDVSENQANYFIRTDKYIVAI